MIQRSREKEHVHGHKDPEHNEHIRDIKTQNPPHHSDTWTLGSIRHVSMGASSWPSAAPSRLARHLSAKH